MVVAELHAGGWRYLRGLVMDSVECAGKEGLGLEHTAEPSVSWGQLNETHH